MLKWRSKVIFFIFSAHLSCVCRDISDIISGWSIFLFTQNNAVASIYIEYCSSFSELHPWKWWTTTYTVNLVAHNRHVSTLDWNTLALEYHLMPLFTPSEQSGHRQGQECSEQVPQLWLFANSMGFIADLRADSLALTALSSPEPFQLVVYCLFMWWQAKGRGDWMQTLLGMIPRLCPVLVVLGQKLSENCADYLPVRMIGGQCSDSCPDTC